MAEAPGAPKEPPCWSPANAGIVGAGSCRRSGSFWWWMGRMVTPTGGSSWSGSSGQWAGWWAIGASLGLAGRPLRTLDRVRAAGGGMPAGGLAAVAVGERPDRLGLATRLVAVALALVRGLHALHRAAGLAPGLVSFGVVVVAGRFGAKRPVGVADLKSLAVVLDQPRGLPPGAPATH